MAQMVKSLPAMQETWVQSLSGEDPLERGMGTQSSILAWRIPTGRETWQATVYGGHKELAMTEHARRVIVPQKSLLEDSSLPFLVDSDTPWPMAASLQALSPSSHGLPSPVSVFVPSPGCLLFFTVALFFFFSF